jgi:hypothetical protein
MPPAAAVRVRPYETRDGPAVRAFWRAGFIELAADLTRTLGPVYLNGPHLAFRARAASARCSQRVR